MLCSESKVFWGGRSLEDKRVRQVGMMLGLLAGPQDEGHLCSAKEFGL